MNTRFLFGALALSAVLCLPRSFTVAAPVATGSAATQDSSLDPLLWQKLGERSAELVRGFDGVVGYELIDLRGGRKHTHNEERLFATASAIKTALLVTALQRLGTGGGTLDEPYVPRTEEIVASSPILSGLTMGVTKLTSRDLLSIMIATSDNTATNVLISRVGMDSVNQLLDRAGLPKTRLRRKMLDGAAVKRGQENVSTPHELALLYEKLWRGELLDKERTQEALRLLSRTKHGYLEAGLPDEVEVYSKPGSLPGLRVDSGLVMIPDRPFVLSVMIAMPASERDAELLIEKLAKEAYSHLSRLSESTRFGRKHP